jgi:hypothetical protein
LYLLNPPQILKIIRASVMGYMVAWLLSLKQFVTIYITGLC